MLSDEARCNELFFEHNGITCDFSRQRVTPKTVKVILALHFRVAQQN